MANLNTVECRLVLPRVDYILSTLGITNAPAMFQRLMNKLFAGWDFVFIYLDDILIASETFSEHIGYLKKVLQRLQQAGFRVKRSKCAIAEHQVQYLGFVLSARKVCSTEKNIEAITLFPRPNSVKEMKQFLELASTGGMLKTWE